MGFDRRNRKPRSVLWWHGDRAGLTRTAESGNGRSHWRYIRPGDLRNPSARTHALPEEHQDGRRGSFRGIGGIGPRACSGGHRYRCLLAFHGLEGTKVFSSLCDHLRFFLSFIVNFILKARECASRK